MGGGAGVRRRDRGDQAVQPGAGLPARRPVPPTGSPSGSPAATRCTVRRPSRAARTSPCTCTLPRSSPTSRSPSPAPPRSSTPACARRSFTAPAPEPPSPRASSRPGPPTPTSRSSPDGLGRCIRTTAVIAAALLARSGKVTFPLPGGDAFCARYIDLHLAAMEAAGADAEVNRGRVRARFPGTKRLPFITNVSTKKWGPSLGATVTAMLLAARTPGTSSILGPSIEPEVTVSADLLARSGVGITWQGADALHVTGTDHIAGGVFPVPSDRLEAATLALAAAITGGTVHLDAFPPCGFPPGLVSVFADTGILLTAERGGTTVTVPAGLHATEMATGPHPGYPTDVQPQLTAVLTQAAGTSRIEERIYSRRDTHLAALRKFGAVVNAEGQLITVEGPSGLAAADVAGEDIRAATALVLAALAAEGTSTIRGMYHLRRGYGDLLPKLAALGASLTIDQEMP
ncbi:hypothetical protein [Kitasatospora sp. NPDC059803]|uniref:hypothetical protein n=1 Tax=Kitasatospora sp. NPDC059803 TaxID=3346953 RepID=UPI003669A9CC